MDAELPLLEERFDVLAVDMPGFGHSEPFPPGVDSTAEALADAVEDEMGRAGFDRAHIAGNSLGGWSARAGATRARGDRHGDLAGGAPARPGGGLGRGHPPELALVGAKRPAAGVPGPEPGRPGPGRRALIHARVEEGPGALAEETELFASNPGFDATLPHVMHAQPRGLTTLDTPVLILWGTLDVVLLPRQGHRFERLIPGAELRYIRGIGHTPMSDAPEELTEAITEFALDREPAVALL